MQILEYATPIETNNNNEIMLDGSEAKRVTIVGQVRNVSEQTTNVTYKLDDGTGTIEVKVWNQEGKDEFSESKSSKQKLEAGMWARATGEVKTMGRKHLLGHNIKRVTDMNEISYHLLDATYVHLYFTKGPIDAKAKTEDGDQMDYAQQNGGGNNLVGVGPLAKKVFQCLQQTEFGQEGLHMQHIASLTNMSMADVGKAGDELIQRSLIYTTIDDQTWAILES